MLKRIVLKSLAGLSLLLITAHCFAGDVADRGVFDSWKSFKAGTSIVSEETDTLHPDATPLRATWKLLEVGDKDVTVEYTRGDAKPSIRHAHNKESCAISSKPRRPVPPSPPT